jgi:hypothetical protein
MTETTEKVRRETPTMRLANEMIRHLDPVESINVPVTFPQGGHGSLHDYLAWAREQKNPDGSTWTWDDVMFDLRVKTGQRVVRESVRQWADRYDLLPVREEKTEDTPAEA